MPEWWIDKDKVLGSNNPTQTELKKLRKKGFGVIISLLNEKKELPNYDVKVAEAEGFRRYNIPIEDFGEPSPKQFEEIIRIVKETPPSTKICIHCAGGLGRTGTAGAAYWIEKGLSADEAIKRIRKSNPRAVETEKQEQSLHRFEEHKRQPSN